MSHGAKESEKLKANLEEQLDRLMAQLKDLEELKDELDDDEYAETKEDTIDQLKEFQESLDKFGSQDGLVDSVGAMQLAIQAAISGTFKSPEVIRMMGKREPGQLRKRLGDVDEDDVDQRVEILTAIKKLGGEVSATEDQFIADNAGKDFEEFEKVSSTLAGVKALNLAGKQVNAAKK